MRQVFCLFAGYMSVLQRKKFLLEPALLSALVDRCWPETHTFHLSCGEMVPTLQDGAYHFGLPIAGDPVKLPKVSKLFVSELEYRFRNVRTRSPNEAHKEKAPGPCLHG
jgi:hypothetical protein